MRRNSVVLCFIFALLFVPGRDANAFIKYLGELSGPGPFVGTELIFPWSLSHPNLDTDTWNHNQATLKRLGLKNVFPISNDVDSFLDNEAQLKFYGELFDAKLDDVSKEEGSDNRVETFLSALEGNKRLRAASEGTKYESILKSLTSEKRPAIPQQESDAEAEEKTNISVAEAVHELGMELMLSDLNDDVRDRIRNFGLWKFGFLSGMNAIPAITDPKTRRNTVDNFFFTLTTSFFVSVQNELPYLPENDSNKTTYWLTAYPSLEYRFWCGDDRQNFFVSAGPGIHFFAGDAFDNFSRISLRGRMGFRYRRIYFGVEGDWFAPPFDNKEFGALPGPNSLDRFNVGFFFGVGVG